MKFVFIWVYFHAEASRIQYLACPSSLLPLSCMMLRYLALLTDGFNGLSIKHFLDGVLFPIYFHNQPRKNQRTLLH